VKILTSASSSVAVQCIACVTRAAVTSRHIVAALLTTVASSATFVNVWNYTVLHTDDCHVSIAHMS